MRLILLSIVYSLWVLPVTAQADIPKTLEELLTEQDSWRAELGISYANSEQQGVSTGQSIPVQIAPAQYIAIPTQVSSSRSNIDTVVLSPGLRYGFSKNTELYSRAIWYDTMAREQDVNGFRSLSFSHFDSVWLGANHQFIEEGKSPALLGFIEVAAIEKSRLPVQNDSRTVAGKSWLVGATTYRVIDPIMLSFTAAYRLNWIRTVAGQDFTPGNYLLFNPSVSFAVNSDISLWSGIQWRNVRGDKLNSVDQSLLRTSSDLNLGIGWQWDEYSTLDFIVKSNLSGNGGANLGLVWTYKLRGLTTPKRPYRQ